MDLLACNAFAICNRFFVADVVVVVIVVVVVVAVVDAEAAGVGTVTVVVVVGQARFVGTVSDAGAVAGANPNANPDAVLDAAFVVPRCVVVAVRFRRFTDADAVVVLVVPQ